MTRATSDSLLSLSQRRAPLRLVVEDAIVLVGNEVGHHVEILGLRHEYKVFGGIVQIASIVHVDVVAATVPTLILQPGESLDRDGNGRQCPGPHLETNGLRMVLEAFGR